MLQAAVWNEEALTRLRNVYVDGVVTLQDKMNAMQNDPANLRSLQNEARAELQRMKVETERYGEYVLPSQHRAGWDAAFAGRVPPAAARVTYEGFTKLNKAAVEQVALSMVNHTNAAFLQVGRQIDDVYRREALKQVAQRQFTGDTIKQTSAKLAATLESQTSIPYFLDQSGRKWKLDNYCTMVARTTTREATTLGTLSRGAAAGYELVQISEHYPTCPECAEIEGLVFTMDPKDTHYHYYDDFIPVHPNCLHTVYLYVPEYDKNRDELRERSGKFDRSTWGQTDNRSPEEKAAYNAIQKGNSQKAALRDQYLRYRDRGYTGTIQSFARAKNAGGAKWQALQADYRKAGLPVRPAVKGAFVPPKEFQKAWDLSNRAELLQMRLDKSFTEQKALNTLAGQRPLTGAELQRRSLLNHRIDVVSKQFDKTKHAFVTEYERYRYGNISSSMGVDVTGITKTPYYKANIDAFMANPAKWLPADISIGDEVSHFINEALGLGAKPKVVNAAQMDKIVQSSKIIEANRGVGHVKYADQFRTGTFFPGHGVYGQGTYAGYGSEKYGVATVYSGGEKNAILRLAVPKDSVKGSKEVIDIMLGPTRGKIEQQFQAGLISKVDRDFLIDYVTVDAGRFASTVGIDAYYSGNGQYMIITNRGILTVQDTPATDVWRRVIN